MSTAKGLTLLELLAALVILSSVAAAGATVLRDGTGISRDAALRQQATEVLNTWRIKSLSEDLGSQWEHLDPDGARWVVSTTELLGQAATTHTDEPEENVELRAHWIRVNVRRQTGMRSDTVMTIYTLAPAKADQGDTSP